MCVRAPVCLGCVCQVPVWDFSAWTHPGGSYVTTATHSLYSRDTRIEPRLPPGQQLLVGAAVFIAAVDSCCVDSCWFLPGGCSLLLPTAVDRLAPSEVHDPHRCNSVRYSWLGRSGQHALQVPSPTEPGASCALLAPLLAPLPPLLALLLAEKPMRVLRSVVV